jgi:hypothetical protein
MEASLKSPAIRIIRYGGRSRNKGCGPRRSCDHSQRADTVDLISAQADVYRYGLREKLSVHMRGRQDLLAKTGWDYRT